MNRRVSKHSTVLGLLEKQGKSKDLTVKQGKDGKPRVLRNRKEIHKTIIGIDPGTKTGVAVWSCKQQNFISIETYSIIKAMDEIKKIMVHGKAIEIWFEDSRLRKWFGDPKKAAQKLQGAGSIKRDCSIWQEFCEMHKVKYKTIAPGKGQTKWPADYFRLVTKWTKRTSEHARDAATLVFGAK